MGSKCCISFTASCAAASAPLFRPSTSTSPDPATESPTTRGTRDGNDASNQGRTSSFRTSSDTNIHCTDGAPDDKESDTLANAPLLHSPAISDSRNQDSNLVESDLKNSKPSSTKKVRRRRHRKKRVKTADRNQRNADAEAIESFTDRAKMHSAGTTRSNRDSKHSPRARPTSRRQSILPTGTYTSPASEAGMKIDRIVIDEEDRGRQRFPTDTSNVGDPGLSAGSTRRVHVDSERHISKHEQSLARQDDSDERLDTDGDMEEMSLSQSSSKPSRKAEHKPKKRRASPIPTYVGHDSDVLVGIAESGMTALFGSDESSMSSVNGAMSCSGNSSEHSNEKENSGPTDPLPLMTTPKFDERQPMQLIFRPRSFHEEQFGHCAIPPALVSTQRMMPTAMPLASPYPSAHSVPYAAIHPVARHVPPGTFHLSNGVEFDPRNYYATSAFQQQGYPYGPPNGQMDRNGHYQQGSAFPVYERGQHDEYRNPPLLAHYPAGVGLPDGMHIPSRRTQMPSNPGPFLTTGDRVPKNRQSENVQRVHGTHKMAAAHRAQHRVDSMHAAGNETRSRGHVPSFKTKSHKSDASREPRLSRKESDRGVTTGRFRKQREKKPRAAQQASPAPRTQASSRLGPDKRAVTSKSKLTGGSSASSPKVCISNGAKVTMIDEEKKVFVIDLLSKEACQMISRLTNEHIKNVEKSGDKSKLWRTLYTYTKMDLPCVEVESLFPIIKCIMVDIAKVVGDIYGARKEAANLRPRSWKEPHLLLYQKEEGKPEHTGIEMHYDGCDITWQIMLSDIDDYEGGGTYFRCLKKTIKLRQGQVLVHPGELYHKGVDITSGIRFLIVGFMDGFDPKIPDNSSQSDDNEKYEKNVVVC